MLVVLVLIWAANWSLVKTVFGYISPPSFVLWRFCGAPVVLAAIMLARRQRLLPARGERTAWPSSAFCRLRSASGSAHSDWVM